MAVTLEQIWNCEREYSPGVDKGIEAQLLKVGEEFGEVCDAYLRRDLDGIKVEVADLLNAVCGITLHVYDDSEELSTRMMNAIHKMAEKYKKDI